MAYNRKSADNAGFNDDIAYNCSDFYRVEDHDPCSGLNANLSPTTAPTGGGTVATTSGGTVATTSGGILLSLPVMFIIVEVTITGWMVAV
jgi:hypothetical protein